MVKKTEEREGGGDGKGGEVKRAHQAIAVKGGGKRRRGWKSKAEGRERGPSKAGRKREMRARIYVYSSIRFLHTPSACLFPPPSLSSRSPPLLLCLFADTRPLPSCMGQTWSDLRQEARQEAQAWEEEEVNVCYISGATASMRGLWRVSGTLGLSSRGDYTSRTGLGFSPFPLPPKNPARALPYAQTESPSFAAPRSFCCFSPVLSSPELLSTLSCSGLVVCLSAGSFAFLYEEWGLAHRVKERPRSMLG